MEERNAYFSNNSSEVKLCHFNVSDENKRETQYLMVLHPNNSAASLTYQNISQKLKLISQTYHYQYMSQINTMPSGANSEPNTN